ncbi:MAG: S4 domain-containing protein, partial [Promicromonosporaceae bacterium]|nr:S4 domain-containing protein [Promicromonosporaceae bacterium]
MPSPSRGGNSARRPSRPQSRGAAKPGQQLVGPKFNRVAVPLRRSPAPTPVSDVHVEDGVRLQKVLADAGYGSRRKAEELIAAARVEVDGQIVTELGVRVDPVRQAIHVDGMRVQLDSSKVTLAVNKPVGMVSAMEDPEGRPTLADLVRDREQRLFHVGRLDA